MLLERAPDRFVDSGVVKREIAQIPDAVAQLVAAGVEDGCGKIQMPVEIRRISILGSFAERISMAIPVRS